MVRKRSEVRILLTAPQIEYSASYDGKWGHPIAFNRHFVKEPDGVYPYIEKMFWEIQAYRMRDTLITAHETLNV